jgi:predicted HTH domain antitoxin
METVEIKFKLPKPIVAMIDSMGTSIEQRVMETIAVDLYRRRQVSLEKAAEIAQVPSVWQMNHILTKHDVWLAYTAEEAEQDWNTLRKVLKT